MHRVAILVHDNIALVELGCAVELFALRRPELEEWYQCDVVSFSSVPLGATGGVNLTVKPVKTLADYTMIVIPSWDTTGAEVPEPILSHI